MKNCPSCGRSMRPAKHELHAGLVEALAQLYEFLKSRKARGLIARCHIRRDLNLSRDAWTNFSKLKWLSLATQFDAHGKKLPRGYWSISQRGVDFIEGRIRIQPGIRTFNKKVVKDSAFGPMVGVSDFIERKPEWEIDSPEPPVEALIQQTLT